jgi:hypothetical protein
MQDLRKRTVNITKLIIQVPDTSLSPPSSPVQEKSSPHLNMEKHTGMPVDTPRLLRYNNNNYPTVDE